jgi:Fe-S cluster assembly iron-binding protein IscA
MTKVAVTEAAAKQLHNLLSEHQVGQDTTLRLVPQPGGRLGIALDLQGVDDELIESNGQTVLVIAPDVASMLDGSLIDVLETAEGHRLTINF